MSKDHGLPQPQLLLRQKEAATLALVQSWWPLKELVSDLLSAPSTASTSGGPRQPGILCIWGLRPFGFWRPQMVSEVKSPGFLEFSVQ